ncbi:S-adenosyl-L-methionine-dependent methyltransferase [Saitoella complicata NRRL Y-17804]|uniref:S-adenosyl-L-methionine-dependent methyltransferase n=1 Tax=Saitoella complicata (strain BCRC 22490 / CBS 7301 / JCM 7358 / NBRC 10748 / NRRL Y-17804) TaxID=698492 RepID=UPI000866A8CC|nr:S-adenosyl-L-methionine-dependent methyltransferase [Saitoella complicata NRRL Y-17804]ODQ56263.1 S-adenosyl-L-methionine-dependent methyltransferase [Saitoella complicata NRRL Y-17804]
MDLDVDVMEVEYGEEEDYVDSEDECDWAQMMDRIAADASSGHEVFTPARDDRSCGLVGVNHGRTARRDVREESSTSTTDMAIDDGDWVDMDNDDEAFLPMVLHHIDLNKENEKQDTLPRRRPQASLAPPPLHSSQGRNRPRSLLPPKTPAGVLREDAVMDDGRLIRISDHVPFFGTDSKGRPRIWLPDYFETTFSESEDEPPKVVLVGSEFVRPRDIPDFGGFLRDEENEVFLLDESVRVLLMEGVTVKPGWSLVFTNKGLPSGRVSRRLVCRYRAERSTSSGEGGLRTFLEDEVPEWCFGYCVADKVLRDDFLDRETRPRINGSRYRLLDAFCGAGGVSRGALMAGLDVAYGFDFDEDAIRTFRANFAVPPLRGEAIWASADNFIPVVETLSRRVDICHISPPCQPFSAAHTTAGKNDDANQATLFAIEPLIRQVKPRICTLEEVPGITYSNSVEYWRSAVRMFLDAGYSTSWRILNTAHFGVPQKGRKRLLLLCSCPGQELPAFSTPTHSPVGGVDRLFPPRTLREALTGITTTNGHSVNVNQVFDNIGFKAHMLPTWDEPYPWSVMTSMPNLHPDGRRFTLREVARLQSFPDDHLFPPEISNRSIGRMIGNAVPPWFAKAYLEEVRKTLEETDRQPRIRK